LKTQKFCFDPEISVADTGQDTPSGAVNKQKEEKDFSEVYDESHIII